MLDIALKEWAIVCDLMLEGQAALLLRKGGIHEGGGPGRFELEHSRFLLFPSWAHQKPEMIKEVVRDRVQVLDEPAEIPFHGWAEVSRIWDIKSRNAFDQLDDLHPWTKAQIDMRFNYKPHNPIYLLALRAYRLPMGKTVRNVTTYAGCKSWVPLSPGDAVDESGSVAAMSDGAFGELLVRVHTALG